MTLRQLLTEFDGRLARLPYLGYLALTYVIFVIFVTAGASVPRDTFAGEYVGGMLALIGVLLPSYGALALTSKRLHDLGHAGSHALWMQLVHSSPFMFMYVSAIASIVGTVASICIYLYLLIAPGNPSVNRYGLPSGQFSTKMA